MSAILKQAKAEKQRRLELSLEVPPTDAASNSCYRCKYELTCGYSPLAMGGERSDYGGKGGSYGPCVLGLKSDNQPFFVALG